MRKAPGRDSRPGGDGGGGAAGEEAGGHRRREGGVGRGSEGRRARVSTGPSGSDPPHLVGELHDPLRTRARRRSAEPAPRIGGGVARTERSRRPSRATRAPRTRVAAAPPQCTARSSPLSSPLGSTGGEGRGGRRRARAGSGRSGEAWGGRTRSGRSGTAQRRRSRGVGEGPVAPRPSPAPPSPKRRGEGPPPASPPRPRRRGSVGEGGGRWTPPVPVFLRHVPAPGRC